MKIAYFTSNRTTFPPADDQIAASITVTQNLISILKNRHQITLYAAKGSRVDGIMIKDLNLPPIHIDSAIHNNDWITKAVIGLKQIYLGEIFRDADQYDLIHIQTEPIYLGMPYIHLIKTPVLFTIHNTIKDYEKPIFRHYDGKINLSTLSKSQAIQIPFSQSLPLIYNGIETSQFNFIQNASDYCLFFGRLNDDKGLSNFLELTKKLPHRKFIIAGRGDADNEKIIYQACESQPNLTFLGMITRKSPKWVELLSQTRALIMPIKYNDSCPLVPLEVMAFGTPVVAYDRGALQEQIIDNISGFIVNPSDDNIRGDWIIKKTGIEGLCEAVERVYTMPEDKYKAMRFACRTHVEKNFTVERMVDEYEKLYEQIVNKNI